MEQWTLQVKVGDNWTVRKMTVTKKAMEDWLVSNRPLYNFRIVPMVTDESRAEHYEVNKT